mmetsp:Transcript_3931/g.12403  ORF Transcript_3931/g.12403 Transcript_3931/m.12403 type:complete len:224 (-) Transcript_3931:461-1132(-)
MELAGQRPVSFLDLLGGGRIIPIEAQQVVAVVLPAVKRALRSNLRAEERKEQGQRQRTAPCCDHRCLGWERAVGAESSHHPMPVTLVPGVTRNGTVVPSARSPASPLWQANMGCCRLIEAMRCQAAATGLSSRSLGTPLVPRGAAVGRWSGRCMLLCIRMQRLCMRTDAAVLPMLSRNFARQCRSRRWPAKSTSRCQSSVAKGRGPAQSETPYNPAQARRPQR